MKRGNFNANMYYIYKDGKTLIIMLYVKDIFLIKSSSKLIIWLKTYLHNIFNIIDFDRIKSNRVCPHHLRSILHE